jgi:hypothetical protein
LNNLHHMEEKEMEKLFHIKFQVKKAKVDALFDLDSLANIIADELVNKFGLEVYDHPSPYPLGWVNKDAKLKVTKQCKIQFFVFAYFINEVEFGVVPLDVCGSVWKLLHLYK